MAISPQTQTTIFGKTVAPNSRAWKHDVTVRGTNLDGFNDLDEIDSVLLRKYTPLIQESQDGGSIAVFHNLRCFRFDGPIEDRQRVAIGVNDLV